MLKLWGPATGLHVKRRLEVYEVVEQITLLLLMVLYDDSTIEELF